MEIAFDPQMSPQSWVRDIVRASGKDIHKVGCLLSMALLRTRHSCELLSNWPSDDEAENDLDCVCIRLGMTVYVFTSGMIEHFVSALTACKRAIEYDLQPVLLFPADMEASARRLAEVAELLPKTFLLTLEDLLTMSVIRLSTENHQEFLTVFRGIMHQYNTLIQENDMDMSLSMGVE